MLLHHDRVYEITNPMSDICVICKKLSFKWSSQGLSIPHLLMLGKEICSEISSNLLDDADEPHQLSHAFSYLFKMGLKIGALYPIALYKTLKNEATRFYNGVAVELNWAPSVKEKRLFEVHTEITATGMYTHTTEELELGARLAWRNSSKCVGR